MTDSKRNVAVERLEDRLRVLADSVRMFAETAADPPRLLDVVARRVAEVVGDQCSVHLVSEDGLKLAPVAIVDRDARTLNDARAMLGAHPMVLSEHPVLEELMQTGEPFFAPALQLEDLKPPKTTPAYFEFIRRQDIRSMIIVALRAHDGHLGALVLVRSGAGAVPYDRNDLSLAQTLADQAALAIARSRSGAAETEARAFLASIVESSNDSIVATTLDGTIVSWNRAATRLFGYSAAEVVGKPIGLVLPANLRDEEAGLLARIARGERVQAHETVRLRKDGTPIDVSLSISPIVDDEGVVVGAAKIVRDLTEQRRAVDALRRTEEQLRHAQKMEAVGRLAGGIAHDFNNILSVILSHGEMLLADLGPASPMREELQEICVAGRRAAELTRQLLMFSRQQVLEPRILDLDDLIASMDRMLRRVLGEDVEVVFARAEGLGRVRADPGSIEQVIMNLVVNARDAMPTGGKLTIETADVVLDQEYAREHVGASAGPHVMLAVSDNGIGMDRATQARMFEPFFTTKGAGRGTGLGLATVFGIVRESGGTIWVYSEPGRGTTFKIFFPRVEGEVEHSSRGKMKAAAWRGTETILLVEDEEQVRAAVRGILRRHGYQVVEARDPLDAIEIAQDGRLVFDLLLTDVVMPHMSGPDLAKRLSAMRPGMKVLCMSGYTDDAAVRHGVVESGMGFLQKPVTVDSLTRKVRQIIDGTDGGPPRREKA